MSPAPVVDQEQSCFGDLGQQLLDAADAELGAAADFANGQAGTEPEPEYVSYFAHCSSLAWHNRSQKVGERTKSFKDQCVERDSG